ncbi:MAG: ParB/RepB/Spo0J family partition protein [Acidobacteria bacterium]|nr:ParB/RepB/Spo0J family partition protein [Acidobacteriota bacterium]
MKTAKPDKRPALGRGLSALIPDTTPARDTPTEVDLDLLQPNRFQPRVQFDEQRLAELAQSIRANGVIQPILVRKTARTYEIIAGERRWRAAQLAGLLKVPVVVKEVPDERLLEVALIENIQRENLNPIDEALAYQRLGQEFGLTQDAIATAVGKDRSSVANFIRLLKLPVKAQQMVASGTLQMGHARALLAIEGDSRLLALAQQVADRGLSVRETEQLVRRASSPPAPSVPPAPAAPDVHTRHAEERLRLTLGTRVRITRKAKGGRIEIDFVSEDELQRLYEQLVGA